MQLGEYDMARREPYTWKPLDIVEVTNTSDENLLLELDSGLLRLDKGHTLRLTASAVKQPKIKALLNGGKIDVQPYRKR
jgi:hypothetical protein